MPRCLIIAGPNGAGKTTFALKYLHLLGIRYFLNADTLANEMNAVSEADFRAADRVYLKLMNDLIKEKEDFAFETTLSGRMYLRYIEKMKTEGWEVGIYYLALQSVDVSKARVAERVAHGGYNIPEADIERRFSRSLRNLLNEYSMKVDRCFCYMNDIPQEQLVYADDGLVFTNVGEVRLIGKSRLYNMLVMLSLQ